MRPRNLAKLSATACLIFANACSNSGGDTSQPKDVPGDHHVVYILAGQSNMAGESPLSAEARAIKVPNVEIFCVDHWKFQDQLEEYRPGEPLPRWEALRPCGSREGFFGPELSFANDLHKQSPDTKFYLLKFAHGGTSLACDWQPIPPSTAFSSYGREKCERYRTILNQRTLTQQTYKRFVTALNWGLSGLKERGITPKLGGVLWFQGETDTAPQTDLRFMSESYGENLQHFVQSVRQILKIETLPFVLGKIKCGHSKAEWDPGVSPLETVRHSQQQLASRVGGVYTFDSMDLTMLPDNCHYDAPSMLTIGSRFAQILSTRL